MAEVNLGELTAYIRADLTHFQRGMQQAQQALAQMQQGIRNAATHTAQAAQANQQLTQSFQQITQATRQATQAQSTWQQALAVAGGLGIATSLTALVSAMVNFGKATVETGTQLQNLRASLSAIGGGVAQGAQQFTFLVETANRLGVAFQPLAQGWRQLTAAATQAHLPLAEQQRLFTAVITEGRRVGATSVEIGRAIQALAQIAGKGCHAPGTLIRMADGTARPVETIDPGDLLCGPDHRPRQVLLCVHGTEPMYRVHPTSGEPFEVNLHHLLRVWDAKTQTPQTLLLATYLETDGPTQAGYTLLHTTLPPVAFTVEPCGEGAYYGFLLSGDHLYLDAQGFEHHNTVSMEELRQQLGEAIPTALGAAARGMGRTTEELIKLVESGSVRFVPFVQALTRGFEQMNQGANAFRDGAAQAFARLGNAMTQFRDAIAQNVLPELERLAKIATDILGTATRLVNLAGGRGAGEAGPGRTELGFTREEEAQAARLGRLRDQLRQQLATATQPVMQETYRTRLQETEALLEQLYAGVRARETEKHATDEVTAANNRLQSQREREAGDLKNLNELLDRFTKARSEFQERARLAPELTGRLGGTEEDAEKYRRGLESDLRKPLEAIIEAQRQFKGLIPPETLQRIQDARAALGQLAVDQRQVEEAARRRRDAERDAQQAEREALAADRERRQQVLATGRLIDQAYEAENQKIEQQFQELQRLAEAYGTTKQARDADTASALEGALANSRYAESAKALADAVKGVALIEAQLPDLRRQAELSAPAGERALKAVQDESAALQTLREDLEQVRQVQLGQGGFPFGASREEVRLRQRTETDIVSPEGLQERERLIALRREADQLNYGLGLFVQLAGGIESAWTNALQSIAEGTKTVSEAFREMARSILQSLAQIASQEAFRALIRMGIGIISSIAAGSAGAGVGAGAGFGGGTGIDTGLQAGFPALTTAQGFQHGGMVTRPTLALLGENPSMNPEMVLNRPQMEHFMQGATRGSMGGEVHVHNHPSREAAERAASQDRAQGHRAVVNEVLVDLGRGEASQISRMMRTLQR